MNTLQKIPPMLCLLISTLFFTSCQSQPDGEAYVRASVEDFETMMTEKAGLLVDVRTPGEFAAGHLEGAVNIDYYDDNFADEMAKLDKSQTLYIYCGSGVRSAKASKVLLVDELPFVKIVDMDGGIGDWQAKGKPIVN